MVAPLRIALLVLCGGAIGRAATLSQADFNATNPWPGFAAYSAAPAGGVSARVAVAPVGTIDTVGSATPTAGLRLTVESDGAAAPWNAGFHSGLLAIANIEPDPAKLTLAFSLSVSLARPVVVRVESFDASGRRTGGLATLVHPAAADFYQRYAIDLAAMTPAGAGAFQPLAPQFQFSFEIGSDVGGDSWPAAAGNEVRVDNVHFASPAYYVAPSGNDTANPGRTAAAPLRTPQRALDLAQPGDIVLLMDGVYEGGLNAVAAFRRAGTPAAWISLKNFPGHHPMLTSTGWNIVSLAAGSSTAPSPLVLAYLEVRGLHVRGEGDVAKQKYPDAMNQADSRTNSNGIAIDGRFMTNVPHHIRLADNLVEYCPGQGLGALEADWITIENNVSRSNCWTTIYGTSGISTLGAANFDATDGNYKMLIRNNVCHRNETFEKWAAVNKYSDGNGIIIDVNQKTSTHPTSSFLGRTLVQNNLSYDNGGSGIHTVSAHRVDIVNNTSYLNSASVNLEYSQIFCYGSDDVRITNNILVAPVANTASGERPEPVNVLNGTNTNVVFASNLYFGGNVAPKLGVGDLVADPRFVNPSRDPAVADFHLKANSPAIDSGLAVTYGPRRDRDGNLRPQGAAPDRGAFESPVFVVPAAQPLGRLVNLSIRTTLVEGQTLIAGFSTTGGVKPLLLRAVGPGLAAFLDGALADPWITFFNSSAEKIDANDNWAAALTPMFSAVGAFPLTTGSRDAALTRSIEGAHTAHVGGTGAGTVLLEAYDLQPAAAAHLGNLSARLAVGTGARALIAGFVVQGGEGKGLLIRGIGPALTGFGVAGALAAPRLEIFSGTTKIADNDGWAPALAPVFASVGAFALPARSADSALALMFPPGAYTAQLSAADGRPGEGLIEIYELP